jgi:mannitol/fructose-specific phosphotransferase system IIA component (Ntr-type)
MYHHSKIWDLIFLAMQAPCKYEYKKMHSSFLNMPHSDTSKVMTKCVIIIFTNLKSLELLGASQDDVGIRMCIFSHNHSSLLTHLPKIVSFLNNKSSQQKIIKQKYTNLNLTLTPPPTKKNYMFSVCCRNMC